MLSDAMRDLITEQADEIATLREQLATAQREAVEAFYAAVIESADRYIALGWVDLAHFTALNDEIDRIREGKDATPDPDQQNRAAFGVGLLPGDRHE